ncbi:MAG TPA: DNA gyrase subunit A [Candidatus Cloacimonadota bacterium]|nr:DNA gyrase subunit A [Candidatus Cloacimonadota bacterium]
MTENKSKMIQVQIEEELKRAYLEYSMSVIISRALPDVRDGLKPSQRRILYAMHELNLSPGGHFRKCAKIAGDTSGNYHPHGEQVVYPTLVRLAQTWNMRYPLIDGQGNFGSIDGDPPAAMRYTEARLQKVTIEMLEDLDKETVDYRPNYDDTRKEPEVFPTKLPNLLINGSSGIAVGMATNMAPHNVGEVCDGIIAMIDNPDMTSIDLLGYIKGPDFPTGGIIKGKSGIHEYFETGRGRLRVQGTANVETSHDGKELIVITEIPYQLNKTLLIEKIAELVKDKRIEGISDIRDESGRQGMRLVIHVKRNADAEVIKNQLFHYTPLQSTFGVINLCLINGEPKVLSMKELLQSFIDFRHDVVYRRTQFELKNAEARLHILEGLRIALDHLDEVIATIRASRTVEEASAQLQEKFGLTEIQAKAILDMRLQRLTGMEREKIEEEYHELVKLVAELKEILEKKELRMNIIKEETLEMKKKYGDARRTKITEHAGDYNIEDLIEEENVIVTITHEGYVKRIKLDEYTVQNRGGRGKSATNLKEDDFIQNIFMASTHSYILFFTNFGKCYWLKVFEIPEASRQARGKAIVNLIPLQMGEKIKAFVTIKDFDDSHFIVMCTRNGLIKKTQLSKYSRPRSSGIIAIKLVDGDELIDAKVSEGTNDILLATHDGYCNRFNESDVRSMGRNSQGVRGIRLRTGDMVMSMVVLKTDSTLLAISENGYGKRTDANAYTSHKRGSKGVITLKTTMRNGYLVALMEVVDSDDLMIITKDGMIIRQAVKDINTIGRNTQGVRLINLNEDDKVFDITRIPEEPEENEVKSDHPVPVVEVSGDEPDTDEDDEIMEDEVDDDITDDEETDENDDDGKDDSDEFKFKK